jgi:hypothetical protein
MNVPYEERKLDTAEKVRREHIGGFHELEDYFFGEEVSFNPDIKLVENTKPKAKVIPFKGKIGAISGDKEDV